MAKYSKQAQKKVAKVMREQKRGKLRSGSGQKVTSRKQAIAIGLSEARKGGAKVPPKKAAKKTPAKRGRQMAKKATKKTGRKAAKKAGR
jgi:hypothetical protein